MVSNSGRVKRQGYDIPAAPAAPIGVYGSAPSNPYGSAPTNYGQPTGGYESPRPSNGYDQPAAPTGYESPTAKGPIPAGQRSGAFQPAAYPPSALYCQCDQISCPPGMFLLLSESNFSLFYDPLAPLASLVKTEWVSCSSLDIHYM